MSVKTSPRPKTSPYFSETRDHCDCVVPSNLAPTSRYFKRSPSSVHGSSEALGPIFATWVSEDWEDVIQGCRYVSFPLPKGRRAVCRHCHDIVSQAMNHFRDCPHMQWGFDEVCIESTVGAVKAEGLAGRRCRSCIEHLSHQMERIVRHLCPNQCYLRGYSPFRDWWMLRQMLMERTEGLVGSLLRSWSCKLVCPVNKDGTTLAQSHSTINKHGIEIEDCYGLEPPRPMKRLRNESPLLSSISSVERRLFHPKTFFVNRSNGLHCTSGTQMIRMLLCLKDVEGKCIPPKQSCNGTFGNNSQSWNVHRPKESSRHTTYDNATLLVDGATNEENSDIASPLGLLEELFVDEPWRLLLSTILLNRTRRNQVDGVLAKLLDRWPAPQAIISIADDKQSALEELTNLIAPLGIKNRRARGIIQFCRDYLDLLARKTNQENIKVEEPRAGIEPEECSANNTMGTSSRSVEFRFTREDILNLYHCGDYCADAYQIFVQRKWENIYPKDHALIAYVEWKTSQACSSLEECAVSRESLGKDSR